MADALFDWQHSGNISDFLLEGSGELADTDAHELLVRTFHLGPYRKATNFWLKSITLPRNFRLSWRYRSESVAGNSMVIFNAQPILLRDLFEDSRPEARYCDLASWRKMVAYTCGFHRAPYKHPSVLRKIGGNVPLEWGMLTWPSDEWQASDQTTRLNTTNEPVTPADKGKWHDFELVRTGNSIRFSVNGALVHDIADTGQYPYFAKPLSGGHLGFRNFGGAADDFYAEIRLENADA